MFPSTPEREAQYIRLMTELKTLYMQGLMAADLKRLLLDRIRRLLVKLHPNQNHKNTAIQTGESNYFSNKRIAVYTAIYGQVDEIHEPLTVPDNCDFYIFTDLRLPEYSSWKFRQFSDHEFEKIQDNTQKNRYLKMHPDLLFPDYDFTLYLDGKFQIRTDPTEFIQNMNETGMKMFLHPLRQCVYQEISACLKLGKGSPDELKKYRQKLLENNFPSHYGLLEGGIIIREVGNPNCRQISDFWWQEFKQNVKRDQISLPFILWKMKIPIENIGSLGKEIWSNPVFRKYPHKK